MHLFDYLDSGNGYKVRLLLAQLGIDYGWTELDIDAGATRTPEFLKRNPNGRIPTLELDDGTNLAESVMDEHLRSRGFFVAERYTIADIALYAYTHVAHEGGHDLAPYANVRAWLARVAAQPGYVGIEARPRAAEPARRY
jgi:glutathione S-transferase